ncbi:MAG: carbohydrate ABC transporter permease [Caldilineaceae bacterium]|nr:carbohydrate ABC transporter permease [Caldilineaceae bacterium]MCB0096340.1 carbohydrate ABC transporter permease [Caldilineaceae bacterium]MCB0141950.1 carbohydrate ABC transporter permease [Caldilineaceae bacterium]
MAETIQRTTIQPAARTQAGSANQWRTILRIALYVVVALGAAASMLPFVWTFLSSGKSVNELYRYPPTWWPEQMRFVENYIEIFNVVPFARWLWNTALVTALALLGAVLSATIVAYGFVRFRFPGRDFFFFVTLATLMLPTEVTLIPTYLLFKNFKWIDTYYPLIVPAWFGGGAFNIFLMRQFMLSIPHDLDEAAKIDGASSWRILWQIIVPLCKPAIATLATLGFIANWNNFLGPLIFLNTESKYTVAVGLRYFQSAVAQGSAVARPQDHLLMGAALLVALPCLILFFIGQKYFVQGIVTTGIKG